MGRFSVIDYVGGQLLCHDQVKVESGNEAAVAMEDRTRGELRKTGLVSKHM